MTPRLTAQDQEPKVEAVKAVEAELRQWSSENKEGDLFRVTLSSR
jgi:hypothetical protein